MEETQSESHQTLVVHSDGKQPKKADVMVEFDLYCCDDNPHTLQPAALLLTPAYIQCLKEELGPMREMQPHFEALFGDIFISLEHDTRAGDLQQITRKLSYPIVSAGNNIASSIAAAINFFVHDSSELKGKEYGPITQEKTKRLLDVRFQDVHFLYVRRARNYVEEAVRLIRTEVLPALPLVEKALDQYVSDYLARSDAQEERRNSWLPSVLHPVFLGGVDKTSLDVSLVKALPRHLAEGSRVLYTLPPFLDRLELYFQRLSKINTQQISDLGYKTTEDLTRLYQDRLACAEIAREMAHIWCVAKGGFYSGRPENNAYTS